MLATDEHLRSHAPDHAYALLGFVAFDAFLLGLVALRRPIGIRVLPAWGFLQALLMLVDISTAPLYDHTYDELASVLYGNWAFDALLGARILQASLPYLGRDRRQANPLVALRNPLRHLKPLAAGLALVAILGALPLQAPTPALDAGSLGLPPAGSRTLDVMLVPGDGGVSSRLAPRQISIVAGDVITFMNHADVAHELELTLPQGARLGAADSHVHSQISVGSDLGSMRTPPLRPLDTASYRFTTPGIYTVLEGPEILGRITVGTQDSEEVRASYVFSQTSAKMMVAMMGDRHGRHYDFTGRSATAVHGEGRSPELAGGPSRVSGQSGCSGPAPKVTYKVVAINVRITLNRFGDNDPFGRMYVLEQNVPAVRAEEQLPLPDRVSIGLRDDLIQPLVIRANLGTCVEITFRNWLKGERASFHLHRGEVGASQEGSNVGFNADSTLAPGGSRTYRYLLKAEPEYEGSYLFHSHGDTREQTKHGLFGVLIAEPKGSVYLHPDSLEPLASGWEAVIANPDATVRAFREFVIMYHEIGDETFKPFDKDGRDLPLTDPLTGIYRPCTRALNYRAECFMRRMEAMAQVTGGFFDESQGYGSYTFGDPATPMPRSYVLDPAKTRLVHAGSEMYHSHHQHGGAIRWRFQPYADDRTAMFLGLSKVPGDVNSKSQRLDVQAIGPGETFDLEHECGSGGCQASVGDFLYHCHFPQHYLSGMWSFWRVFNTLQPDLQELPDRQGRNAAAVNSIGLLGRTLPSGTFLTVSNIEAWVESNLPPPGVPQGYDATVWDWTKVQTLDGPLYYTEPEDTRTWPSFESPTPGQRRQILFDPTTGRPAWSLLTPHLGKRPPFAPGAHGPAPHLMTPTPENQMPTNSDHPFTPADPERPFDALCPAGSPIRRYNLVALTLPIPYNAFGDTDPNGQIFALVEEAEDILAGRKPAQPLVLRGNVGDCIEFTLVSRLVDFSENHEFSKVNMHEHFVQFDVQATDGVITGRAFEQSVRPYATEGRALGATAAAGQQEVVVTNPQGLRPGIWIGVGLGTPAIELHRIAAIAGNTVTLVQPLVRSHDLGEAVGVEFVRQAWFLDVNFGTVYFHDHVALAISGPHGLFGALVAEPEGSTYRHPGSGAEVRSGPIADIITPSPVAADLTGRSFREMVLLFQDTRKTLSGSLGLVGNDFAGSSFNLRNAPLDKRLGVNSDPSLVFSSVTHGDPETPLLRAYEGDPVVIRLLQGGTNDVHGFRISGHRFRLERYPGSAEADALHIAIAERFDLVLEGGAGKAGDYLYYNTMQDKLVMGMWGIFRVHNTEQGNLLVLPDRTRPPTGPGFPFLSTTGGAPPKAPAPGNPCPASAPVRRYSIHAIQLKVPFNKRFGITETVDLYLIVDAADAKDVLQGKRRPDPVVVRANAGDCVEIRLFNALQADLPVSLHAGRVVFDPQRSQGITVGYDYGQSVRRGEKITYRVFVDKELGAGLISDFAQLPLMRDENTEAKGVMFGLFGALVSAAAGSRYYNPATGGAMPFGGWRAIVRNDNKEIPAYWDYVLVFQDQDMTMGKNMMPYHPDVRGISAVNYRTEPLGNRMDKVSDASKVFDSKTHGDPETPLLEAAPGDPVRVHVVGGFGFQAQVFALDGYYWYHDPALYQSSVEGARGFVPHEVLDIRIHASDESGDYLYQNHRMPFLESGQWGILRVSSSSAGKLKALISGTSLPADSSAGGPSAALLGAVLVAFATLSGAFVIARGRRSVATAHRSWSFGFGRGRSRDVPNLRVLPGPGVRGG